MLHTNNQIIKHKVGLLNLAEELQNVSKACKVMGVSRRYLLSLSRTCQYWQYGCTHQPKSQNSKFKKPSG